MSVPDLPTRPYRSDGSPSPSGRRRPTHCAVAGHLGNGSQFDADLAALLQHRLRLVSVIALVPTALFLIVNVLFGLLQRPNGWVNFAIHGIVVVLLGWLTAVVWLSHPLSLCPLRKIELALFGTLGAFFCFLQTQIYANQALFNAAAACVLAGEHGVEIIRLEIAGTAARWLFLIIVYGVFIPNTWRRCALITGLMAVAPLLITPAGAWLYGRYCPQTAWSLVYLAIIDGTAMAVAVFGSYRLQALQREAFQAKQLGQYRLGKKLGQGGMGEVYKAEHLLLRRPVAIKLIRPGHAEDSLVKRFEREVQAMATLTHPNTVEVYDYGVSPDGTFYYVMEYLPGMNLEGLVTKYGPMPIERAVHFLRQLCKALREAHSIGLLHRDVKPSNVIAAQRGGVYDVAKLLDFGLVQDMGLNPESDRLTLKGTVLGSPPYLSPEQAAGRTDVDARTDVYSLGGVGYFLLTGQPPFIRETAMEMLLAHAYESPVPPSSLRPEVPADVEAVILRALAKKPEDRFATVDAMEKALAACAVADGWDEEQAEQWWKTVPLEAETAAAIPTMTTPRVG